jgi:hypothetical protein
VDESSSLEFYSLDSAKEDLCRPPSQYLLHSYDFPMIEMIT